MDCSPNYVKIIITETKNIKPEKGTRLCVCSIMASRTAFIINLVIHAKEMRERVEFDARMKELREKNEAKLSLQRKTEMRVNRTKLSIDDIAVQLVVSKEKLQELIDNERKLTK
jgi:hypothetical protein